MVQPGDIESFRLCVQNSSLDLELALDDGTIMKARRLPLARESEFFRVACFTFGSEQSTSSIRKQVKVPMLSSTQLASVLEFCYQGHTHVSVDNVQDVLEAADFLGVESLIAVCTNLIESQSNTSNVVDLWHMCDMYLQHKTRDVLYHGIMEHFIERAGGDEIMNTSFEEFLRFVTDDSLNIRNEEQLWRICEKWINHDRPKRIEKLFELLKAIRFFLIDEGALRELLSTSELLQSNEICHEYICKILASMKTRSEVFQELCREFPEKTLVPREPHGVILLLGGWLQSPSNIFEVYDPSADRHTIFENLSDLNEARAYHKMVLIESDIFVIGGFHADNHYHKYCRKYNLRTKSWSHVTPMNVERCYVSVTMIGDTIYAIGGYNGRFRLNTAEVLNIRTNQWSYIRPMEFQRSDAACVSFQGKVYAIGGFTGTTCNRSVECYDPATDRWTVLSNMSTVRSGLSAVELDGKIYALGGSSGTARLSSCEVYDPETDTWTPIAPMLTGRSNFAAVVCDSLIYVFGGYTGDSTTRLCECYSPISNQWFVLTDMSFPRSALAALYIPCFEGIKDLTYPNRNAIFFEAQRPAPLEEEMQS